ncbi:MAG: serine hydrolase domain-containing protein [Balneola sp.]
MNLFSQASPVDTQKLVQDKGVTDPIHKSQIGKIRFLSGDYPVKKYSLADFLNSFEIDDESNLSFIAFFDNSLTNYLHELNPSLNKTELIQNGNFEFSFYLDGKLIYKEHLNSGAGLPIEKDENTSLHKPLLSSRQIDSWGRFLWLRFLYRSDAHFILEEGIHTLKIELRPYLKTDTLLVGNKIAEGEISISFADPHVSEEQTVIQTITPNSGWNVSDASYDSDRIRGLNKRIAQNRFKHITSVIVIKNGELLIEEYFNGAGRNTLHNTRSVGKSFASTITGIALNEGFLKNTNQTLGEFYDLKNYDHYTPEKAQVSIEHLLTMSSGFKGNDSDYDSPGNEENMYPTNDWVKFALDLPMDQNKTSGKQFEYFTAGVVVLGDILDKTVPGGLEAYAHQMLFEPLEITNYQWQHTPHDVANTAGGLQLRSVDYAKYGQLYINNGVWGNEQILTPEWVKKSHSNYYSSGLNETPYGYLFWKQSFTVNGKTYDAYLCNGNGGNKIVMFKNLPIVIVITSTAYGQFYAHPQSERIIQNYLLPAVLME